MQILVLAGTCRPGRCSSFEPFPPYSLVTSPNQEGCGTGCFVPLRGADVDGSWNRSDGISSPLCLPARQKEGVSDYLGFCDTRIVSYVCIWSFTETAGFRVPGTTDQGFKLGAQVVSAWRTPSSLPSSR